MPYISFHELSFTHENSIKPIFENISLTLPLNKVGIVGNNGYGKSTLLKLISNKLQPTSGTIKKEGIIYHVSQITDTSHSLCQALGLGDYEDAYLRIQQGLVVEQDFILMENHWQLFDELKQILNQISLPNVDVFGKANQLSHGQLQMLNLRFAFAQKSDFILLDEPTNHLDGVYLQELFDLVSGYLGNLVIASHHRKLLQMMDSILEIESPNTIHVIGGNYDEYINVKEQRIEKAKQLYDSIKAEQKKTLTQLQKQHDQQQKRQAKGNQSNKNANLSKIDLDKRKNNAEQFAGKLNKDHQAAKEKIANKASQAYQNLHKDGAFNLTHINTSVPENRIILTTNELILPFNCGQVENLRLQGNFRLQIKGVNGSGKSTLLTVLKQELSPIQGNSEVHVPFADLTQSIKEQYLNLSLLDILPTLNSDIPQSEMRTHLAQIGLTADLLNIKIANLSGGEKIKAMLFILLHQEQIPQLLIFDEPTNHLDLEGVIALEQFINEYQGNIIFISHDDDFTHTVKPTLFLSLQDSIWRLV